MPAAALSADQFSFDPRLTFANFITGPSNAIAANAAQIPYRDWQMDSALWVAYRLAEILPLAAATKVAVLQADNGLAALSHLDAGMQAASIPPPRGAH